ncbi:MAG: UvrD-helicase domain-containing protein, partial [Candidatus Adiutrix sp.]
MANHFKPNPSQLKVIQCRRNLCVIAGAGSGKTGTLVECVLNRLEEGILGEPINITQVLALTFTDKAASEMRQRLGEAFSQKQITDEPNWEFWRKQAGVLDRADIGTIHSFALKIVRENTLPLGLVSSVAVENDNRIFRQDLENIMVDWLAADDKDYLTLCETFS